MSGASRRDSRPGTSTLAGETPALSLVVASRGEPGPLRALLAAVLPVAEAHRVEVVVARSAGEAETAGLARAFPGVRFVAAPEDAAPGALRFTGMAAAGGDVVMLALDDDPAAPERLLHLCRTYAAVEPAAEAVDDHLPARPAAPERRGAVERAGRPAWAAAV